jgi:hypothetical protein
MKTLKNLHAKIRKLCEGGSRRQAKRQCPLAVEGLEERAVPAALVLGSDGNLWQESPGWQQNGRLLIDGHVRGFAQANDGYIYVLGTDGNLWQEFPYWQLTNGRTWVDGNVRSFARGNDGYDYVLGTSGTLWQELPGWQQNGRTRVDGNVESFARGNDGFDYVLGTSGNLWRELPGWQQNGRTLVDGSVQSFARGNDGYDYVLGTDGNLWQELPGWQQNGRTQVDGHVLSFTLGNDGYDYVLGADLNLWRELPGWQQNGRTWIDGNVEKFARGDDGYDYVMGTNGVLWQELPGWQQSGRTRLDGNVQGFVVGNAGYFVALAARPVAGTAYSPVTGTLFNPNTNAPSYLDVQQGSEADCWLLASLAEAAVRAPGDIQSMFLHEGSTVDSGTVVNVYAVRFYDNSGKAEYVTVDTELPGGGGTYDHPVGGSGAVNGSPNPVLWVALAEKAYAEAGAYGIVTTRIGGWDAYDALGNKADANGNAGGVAYWALQGITGKAASNNGLNPSDVANAWNAGQLVVLCTPKTPGPNASPYIVSWHCYALVNYNANNSYPFLIFNPWGKDPNDAWAPGHYGTTYGLFMANASGLSNNFSGDSFGNGAAPVELDAAHPGSSQAMVDQAFIDPLPEPREQTPVQNDFSQAYGSEATPGEQQSLHVGRSQESVDLAFVDDLFDPHALTPFGSTAADPSEFARS